MPPKKITKGATGEANEGKLTWEGPNDLKLYALTFGRKVTTANFEKLSTAFPGATAGAIRNRIGHFRKQQKMFSEELGWEVLSGETPAKKGKATPSKRASPEDGEVDTPTKKPRTPRKKKEIKAESLEKKDSGAEDDEDVFDGVKSEPEEI